MKKLGILLIVLGVLITSYPIVQQWVDNYLQDRMLDDMAFLNPDVEEGLNDLSGVFDDLNEAGEVTEGDDAVSIEGYEEFTDSNEAVNGSQTEGLEEASVVPTTTKALKPTVKLKALGKIEIPVVKIKMPIVEGTGTEALRRSVGHMTGTDLPGEIGNSVLAGHRGYSYGRLFNRLDELKVGDQIIVTTKKGKYTYEVYETKIVKPTDLSVLNRNSRDKVLTLITCTPMFKSTHRIIIHAVLR